MVCKCAFCAAAVVATPFTPFTVEALHPLSESIEQKQFLLSDAVFFQRLPSLFEKHMHSEYEVSPDYLYAGEVAATSTSSSTTILKAL